MELVVALVLAVMAVAIANQSIIVVPRDAAYIVERLGRYHVTLTAGPHFITPFIDRVAFRHTLLPTDTDLSDVCIASDNLSVTVSSSYKWRIVDPKRFTYSTADGPVSLASLVRSHQRTWIGGRRLQEVREGTRDLETAVMRSVTEPARQLGVEIAEVTIHSIARAEV